MQKYCRDCAEAYPHPDYKWTLACRVLGLTTYLKDRGDGVCGLLVHNHINPDIGKACEHFKEKS